jgi:hypothetical protein
VLLMYGLRGCGHAYIRNIIPDGMGVPSPAVLALLGCGYARFHAGANFALTAFLRSSA